MGVPGALHETDASLGPDFVVREDTFVGALGAGLGDASEVNVAQGSTSLGFLSLDFVDDFSSLPRPVLCDKCRWMLGAPTDGHVTLALDALTPVQKSVVLSNASNGAALFVQRPEGKVRLPASSGDSICVFQHDERTGKSSTVYCEVVP